ncbi:MAG: ATP-binding cassette domain-containing protein, partial [Clostridiales bacterium]|nr:ATP-binding cassette domain-containing protein [Clostridiales bacterium]
MNLDIHGGSCGHSCCLRVENLSVKIGGDCILSNVNLHVHCGELVALIGPNGAGKSTFLKAVLGQRDYEGVIAFSEPGQRSKKPRIGYVPQSPAFDPSDPVSVADLFACCMSRRPAFLGLGK